jgi:hypothetical protein
MRSFEPHMDIHVDMDALTDDEQWALWRANSRQELEAWLLRHAQQLKAAGTAGGAAKQRVDGKKVKRPMSDEEKLIRSLISKLVLRLSEILTPAESKQVTVASQATRYPLVAPPAVERKIYTDPVAQILLAQLGRKLAEAEQAAFKITIT